jgi:predicted RNA-binding protein with RPS1 domain
MEQQKKGMFTGLLKKENGKLVHVSNTSKEMYKSFVDMMEEGQTVNMFMDLNVDNGTLPQIAKIHACIREIVLETGNTVENVKKAVKDRCGLVEYETKDNNENVKKYKSFANCSKQELELAINEIISLGDFLQLNFRS